VFIKKEGDGYMQSSRMYAVILLLFILSFVGCAKKMIINIDGMPISNHEYQLTNEETGIRTVFVLTKQYREYEGKEFIIKPEYLDALHVNRIQPEKIERLGMHIKVVNTKRKEYSLSWQVSGPNDSSIMGLIYRGRISRRDFYLPLPFDKDGTYEFLFTIADGAGDDMYNLPLMRYKVKGGIKDTTKGK